MACRWCNHWVNKPTDSSKEFQWEDGICTRFFDHKEVKWDYLCGEFAMKKWEYGVDISPIASLFNQRENYRQAYEDERSKRIALGKKLKEKSRHGPNLSAR